MARPEEKRGRSSSIADEELLARGMTGTVLGGHRV
jgi:hypothetical protein